MLIRASELHHIMGDGKGSELTVTAKTFLSDYAKEFVYGYNEVVDCKEMRKGIQCEAEAIELYNSVFFTNYQKNTVRKTNKWVSGECDIVNYGKNVVDIKNAWSLKTFPATIEKVETIIKKSGYDWQLDVYMMLFDVPCGEIAYCMVSTPEELLRYEQMDLHQVDHIDPTLRVTRCFVERNLAREEKIKVKCEAANEYLENTIAQILFDHK